MVLDGALAADRQHIGIDVEDRDLRLRAARLGDAKRHIAGAARNIEMMKGARLRRLQQSDEPVLPRPMQKAGHQIVHHVIAIGNPVKHLIDMALLVVQGHLAEAEMSLFHRLFAHSAARPRLPPASAALCLSAAAGNRNVTAMLYWIVYSCTLAKTEDEMSYFSSMSTSIEKTLSRKAALAAATAVAGLLTMTAPSFADIVHLTATLTGSQEVPPNTTKGTGTLTATYDTLTRKLTWSLTYSGLTGPVIAAHFHGPAKPDKNAPVAVPLTNVDKSPIEGSAVLTETQANDLLSGNIYVNIHTHAHALGEIRGQVLKGNAS